MRRSGIAMFLAMCCFRMAQSQYDDTIKGKLQVMYNEPNKFKASLIAGTAIETQGTEGGVGIPSAFLTLRLKPVKPIMLFGTLNHQFQWAWKWQNIKDTRNWEAGIHIFLNNKRIEKWKTFTAGTGAWNYDFTFPVKVAWNVGITGNYRQGSAVFNSGTDKNNGVKFRNHHDSRVYSLEKAAIPYTFSEISAGFIVSTATRMKLYAHLPDQTRKSRRMKTYTEFRIEGVFMPERNYDSLIVRKPAADATKYFTYDVIKGVERNWGLRFSGFFSRKWYSMRFETGISPGITYRFAGAQGRTPFDRSYLLLGLGIGWM